MAARRAARWAQSRAGRMAGYLVVMTADQKADPTAPESERKSAPVWDCRAEEWVDSSWDCRWAGL
jgi:hypothetical protein